MDGRVKPGHDEPIACLHAENACVTDPCLFFRWTCVNLAMTYIVNEACIKCKYMDCVEVCPVDCFYEGENMLVIHPDECIDCGVCEPECPADAIKPDTEAGRREMGEHERRILENLAEYHGQEGRPGRRQVMGGRPGQIRETFFSGTGYRKLS